MVAKHIPVGPEFKEDPTLVNPVVNPVTYPVPAIVANHIVGQDVKSYGQSISRTRSSRKPRST